MNNLPKNQCFWAFLGSRLEENEETIEILRGFLSVKMHGTQAFKHYEES